MRGDYCTGDCRGCRAAASCAGPPERGGMDGGPAAGPGAVKSILLSVEKAPDALRKSLAARCPGAAGIECGGFSMRLTGPGERPDVVIASLDCMNLEESLLQVTYIMDTGVKAALVADRYDEYLATGHSIRFDVLGMLLGFPIVGGSGDSDAVLKAAADIYSDSLWLPKSIQGRHIDEEEHARLGFVTGALQETVCHSNDDSKHTISQKVDALLTNRWLGLPLLALVLFALFQATFAIGAYPQSWIEYGVDLAARSLSDLIPSGWVASMLTDGVVRGVGAVLAFVPNIVILFFFLSILEDSGYMARAAYVMDKIMHHVGLHGNSFIPMLIGFGCNVPAIMAARSIQNRRDRVLTMLMIPFMSCSARLPVYMLFVSAFFPRHKALVMLGLYVAGVILAILFAWVMKRTAYFRQKEDDYVSELPPFHAPRMRDTMAHIWDRVKDYLQKISSVILAASVIIWALEYFPADRTDGGRIKEESALASIGHAMTPLTAPLGFDWKMNVCLLTGLPAKEAIVSTMGILYHIEDEESLSAAMQESSDFDVAKCLSFLLFVLLYFPCAATISALRREAGTRWAVFTIVNSNILAWVLSFLLYQGLTLFLTLI